MQTKKQGRDTDEMPSLAQYLGKANISGSLKLL